MSTTSSENLVKQIVEIFNDRTAFSNKSEERVTTALGNAYREFAKEHGFGLDVGSRGMRGGLGALCGNPPDDYLVEGNGGDELQIWIGHARDNHKMVYFKRVQITIQDDRLGVAEDLKRLISVADGDIRTNIYKTKETAEATKQYAARLMEAMRE